MFGKNSKKEEKKNYDLSYENLAIPEIHTHEQQDERIEDRKEDADESQKGVGVVYDSVAIPEIHVKKKKN